MLSVQSGPVTILSLFYSAVFVLFLLFSSFLAMRLTPHKYTMHVKLESDSMYKNMYLFKKNTVDSVLHFVGVEKLCDNWGCHQSIDDHWVGNLHRCDTLFHPGNFEDRRTTGHHESLGQIPSQVEASGFSCQKY